MVGIASKTANHHSVMELVCTFHSTTERILIRTYREVDQFRYTGQHMSHAASRARTSPWPDIVMNRQSSSRPSIGVRRKSVVRHHHHLRLLREVHQEVDFEDENEDI